LRKNGNFSAKAVLGRIDFCTGATPKQRIVDHFCTLFIKLGEILNFFTGKYLVKPNLVHL